MAIVDTRPFEKLARELIKSGETFFLQFLVSPNTLMMKEFVPNYKADGVCDSYFITTNTFIPRRKTDRMLSEKNIDFSKLKKIPRLTETETFAVAGGIITQHVAIVLSSGYHIYEKS